MRPTLLTIACLFGLVMSSLFSDIIKGLFDSESSSITGFLKTLPKDVLSQLENNDQQAGQFVCAILNGSVPGIIDDLDEDVKNEIENDMSAVVTFIQALPTLGAEVLQDIVQDGEDVASVVGDIFTNPGGLLTVIDNGASVVVSDIESVGGEAISFVKCLFNTCSTSSADPAATLSASCQAIMAAATTTYSAAATTVYSTMQTSTPVSAAPSSTTVPAASTSVAQAPAANSTTAAKSGSGPIHTNVVHAWAGILACFITAMLFL